MWRDHPLTTVLAARFGIVALMLVAAWSPVTACTLTVGWTPWTPYMDETEDGSLQGIDIDALRAIAERADCAVDFVSGEWSRLLHEIEHGGLQALPGAAYSEDRAVYARFSEPYRQGSMRLFVRADDREGLATLTMEAFLKAGRTVSAVATNYYGPVVAALMDDPETKHHFSLGPSNYRGFWELDLGTVDGVLANHVSGTMGIQKLGFAASITVHPMRVHDKDTHIMLSKAAVSDTIAERIDAAILAVVEAGTIEEIFQRYLTP